MTVIEDFSDGKRHGVLEMTRDDTEIYDAIGLEAEGGLYKAGVLPRNLQQNFESDNFSLTVLWQRRFGYLPSEQLRITALYVKRGEQGGS